MLYPEEIIEEVRISNDIIDVISEYVKLEKKGKDYFGLCPFHKEKTPSFSVAPAKQIFYCFGCGKGGNVFQFIMNAENLDYLEAVRYLADRAKIQLPEGESSEEQERAKLKQDILSINLESARFFHEQLSSASGENARQYLKKRGLKDQTIRRFGLGYSPEEWDRLYKFLLNKGFREEALNKSGLVLPNKKGSYYDRFRGRIIFPIFDIRGNVIGFGGRVMDNSLPKYMNSPETVVYNKGKSLYAMNFAKNSGEKRLLIVEGYMDVISLHQNGIINTVASLGTALTESQGRILKKYAEEIIISYDADTAGQAATMRGLDLLNEIGCNVKVLVIPESKDPDEFIRKNGVDEFNRLIDKSLSLIEYKIRILKNQANIETTEGKIEFLNKMAGILAKIDNHVEAEMYIKKFAGDYGISEESIYSEVYKKSKPRNTFRTAVVNLNENARKPDRNAKTIPDSRLIHDERFILALLSIDNSVYKAIRDKINIESFTNVENQKIARVVFEKLEDNKGIVPGELLSIINGDAASDFTKIINEECHCDDNKKAILGTIRNIEIYKTEKRQKDILELLKKEDTLQKGDVEKLKLELKSLTLFIKNRKAQ